MLPFLRGHSNASANLKQNKSQAVVGSWKSTSMSAHAPRAVLHPVVATEFAMQFPNKLEDGGAPWAGRVVRGPRRPAGTSECQPRCACPGVLAEVDPGAD